MTTTLVEREGVTITQLSRGQQRVAVQITVAGGGGDYIQLTPAQAVIVARTLAQWLERTGPL